MPRVFAIQYTLGSCQNSMPLPGAAVLKNRRWIKASAYAAFAFAAFSLWALPLPLYRDAAGWHWSLITIIQVPIAIAAGIGVLRGLWFVVAGVGLLGLYRLLLFGLALVRVVDGTAAQSPSGPAWVLSIAITTPFAICWFLGGLTFLRDWRTPAPIVNSRTDR
jgi:hypothetical protein